MERRVQSFSAAIIGLGQSLGLKVIAEGVEKRSHLEMLAKLKCDEAQGYLFAKPLFEEDFIEYARATRYWPNGLCAQYGEQKETPSYSMAG